MRNAFTAAALPLALAACTVIPPPSSAPATAPQPPANEASHLAWAALGQQIVVGGLAVTPLELLEDSRCPANVQCVWAGQVRLRVATGLGSGEKSVELTSGKPVPVMKGMLELVEVRPAKTSEAAFAPGDYRFGFRFSGGF
jgi:hypothetical protein